MAFWSDASLEPHRQFRWYINFLSDELKPLRYALKKAARPTVKIGEIKHKYMNHDFYYPGRVEWEPITITIAAAKVDDNGNTASANLRKLLTNSGYVYPTTPENTNSNYSSISKVKATSALAKGSSLSLIQVAADGTDSYTWYLFNPFFTDVKFDQLDYASEEIMNIDCTVKYDWASLQDPTGAAL